MSTDNTHLAPARNGASPHVTHNDYSLLHLLRLHRRKKRAAETQPLPDAAAPPAAAPGTSMETPAAKLSLGQRLADIVASSMGSWAFIIVQSAFLTIWIVLNTIGALTADPFPYILLNLMLSFQAAYAAPFIMMSQNRQSEIDRSRAIDDYNINLKAELEIEVLHQKIDTLRSEDIARLTRALEEILVRLPAKT